MLMDIYTKYKAELYSFSPRLIKQFGAVNGLFLSSLLYWQYSQKLYNDNYFCYCPEQLELQTGLDKEQQLLALNSLLDSNVIEIKYEGLPVNTYIRLNEATLLPVFEITQEQKTKIEQIAKEICGGTAKVERGRFYFPTKKQENIWQRFAQHLAFLDIREC